MGFLQPLAVLFGENHDVVDDRNFRLILLANLAGPLGAALVSPLLDTLRTPFGVTATEIGLLITVFTAPGILIVPLSGVLADTYGRKPVLLFGLLLFGAAGTSIALTTDFHVVLALRFLQGAGLACITPVLITSIGDMYDGERETTGQGLRFGVSGLTATVFPVLAGSLVVVAWQYPFLIYAISFPLAGVVHRWFDEPSPTEGDPGASRARRDTDGRYLSNVAGMLLQVRVVSFLVARIVPVFVYVGFLTYNSIVVVQIGGGTPVQAGILVGVCSIAYALSATQAGRIESLFDGTTAALVGANVCLGLGLSVLVVVPRFGVAVVGTALLGLGFGVSMSLYRSIVTGLAPEEYRGGLVSVGETVGRVGATITPVVLGAAVTAVRPEFGFSTAVRWTLTSVGLGGAILGIASVVVMANTSTRPV